MTAVATKERANAKAEAEEMKLTIDRGDLFRALTHAAAIVERRNTIPVLSNVLLEAAGDKLKITSTDLDLQIALTVAATIEGEGSTTVSAQLLHGIVREMADGSQVELAMIDGRLEVRSGRSNYKLQVLKADRFPVLPIGNATSTFSLPAADLLRSLRRVEFAQSTEETRYYLRGILTEVVDGKLFFVATDGNALGFTTLPAPSGATVENAILPTKLVVTLAKLLDEIDGDVRLFFNDKRATFEIGSTVLTGKLVDGAFPNWRRVLPVVQGNPLRIETDTLESAIRRATIVATERTRSVTIELSKDKLTASCSSAEHGNAVEEAPCAWDGGEFRVGFNATKLLSAIKASGAEQIQLDLIDDATPPIISNPADDSAKWVVTTMRV
ncbi:MAG: DNA polymerase III subunit beta [Methylocystis sp.]|uniref:DNA polymerase III subunit beta n=1 Tax=Methylocystis sp. TaxID=1911079 RepID=UPI003DA31B6D